MNKLLKEARLLLLDVRRNVTMPDRNEARIDKFLRATAPKPKSKGGRLRRIRPPGMTTKEIWAAVFDRAGSNCELCISAPATELHHLEGGSGRLALQAVSNCMATCRQCHRFFHNAPETYRQLVLTWAADYGYPVPRRFRGEPKPLTPNITHAQLKRSAP